MGVLVSSTSWTKDSHVLLFYLQPAKRGSGRWGGGADWSRKLHQFYLQRSLEPWSKMVKERQKRQGDLKRLEFKRKTSLSNIASLISLTRNVIAQFSVLSPKRKLLLVVIFKMFRNMRNFNVKNNLKEMVTLSILLCDCHSYPIPVKSLLPLEEYNLQTKEADWFWKMGTVFLMYQVICQEEIPHFLSKPMSYFLP